MIWTKTLQAVLICLLIFAVFNYTAATTLGSLIQQDSNLVPNAKTALYNSQKASPKAKSDLIKLGDPVEDPIPQNH